MSKLVRKPGRPQGAKNRGGPEIEDVRPLCTRCLSDALRRTKSAVIRRHDLVIKGVVHPLITWHPVQCVDCGLFQRIRRIGE